MSTHTASQLVTGSVKAPHTGTAGSTVLLCRVPNGATILDWFFWGTTGGTDQAVIIGTSQTPSALSPTISISATPTNRPLANLLPVTISISDDVTLQGGAGPNEVWIQAQYAITFGGTLQANFRLFYTMDGTGAIRKIR